MTTRREEGLSRTVVNVARFAPPWDLADAMRKSLRGMPQLSVEEIARQLGVSRNSVGNWLSGRVEPNGATLIAWAQLTAVPYRWLVARKNSVNPLRGRFTDAEMERFRNEAAERGVTVSVLLREYSEPLMPEDELELFDDSTLMQMWFANHRIYVAQREDTGPPEMADATSLYSPIMSTRIEQILNRRGVWPALELDRQTRQLDVENSRPVIEWFTIVFEWDNMPRVGSGPVAAISRVNGVFPSLLIDPIDQNGAVVSGRWEYDGVDEQHGLVIYHHFGAQ
jgi:transcriptional regulator with XRE-family HTH domain